MRKHVIVFDNSHRDERNENFMTIGLGLKDPKQIDKAVLKQYDETVEGYKHSKEDSSKGANDKDTDNLDALKTELDQTTQENEKLQGGLSEFEHVY